MFDNLPVMRKPAVMHAFEELVQFDDNGNEFWSARDMMALMDYSTWKGFQKPLKRAYMAFSHTGNANTNHFKVTTKTIFAGNGAKRQIEDQQLSRMACYQVMQSGNPRHKPVAIVQSYFAIQTIRAQNDRRRSGEVAV